MPVATVSAPRTARPATSSPLASSSISPSSSLTLSQAKNLYSQAARHFLHRRHVDALLAVEKAFIAFQDEGLRDRSLAERLMILRLTLLATIYHPHEKTSSKVDLFDQLKKAGKPSAQDDSIIVAVEAILALPTSAFLARLWVDILRFYGDVLPRLHSILSRPPPISMDKIAADGSTLSSALQLPAGVVAAAIMGALKIDDESKGKGSKDGLKSKKESASARSKSEADISEGLLSARSMCEWVMSAHSKTAGTYSSFNQSELDHLYQQYTRVLELYTLHILGTRLDQWELAHQVARCAVEVREDEQELKDRQNLLDQLTSAQVHISGRGERRRIASEKARQRYEDEKAKRVASAEQQAKLQTTDAEKIGKSIDSNVLSGSTSGNAKDTSPSSSKPAPALPQLKRADSGVSNASSNTSASEMESEGGIPSRRKSRESSRAVASSGSDYAESRAHISNQLERHHKRASITGEGRSPLELDNTRSRRLASSHQLHERLLAWIRDLGGNPGLLVRYLSAVVATLFILRRTLAPAQSRAALPSRAGAGAGAGAGAAAADSTRTRLERAKRQDESVIVTAARKVWSTLRMGTQVTYL